ncbi:MAG: hypothetical protein LBS52_04855 [Dysgonamonadaceae bacterium]|jgi:hypothetical protein|nr:hypothetical protein [Dysgonamonadaceae bacterium]
MKKKAFLLCMMCVFSLGIGIATAQTVSVSGTVADEENGSIDKANRLALITLNKKRNQSGYQIRTAWDGEGRQLMFVVSTNRLCQTAQKIRAPLRLCG